MRRSSVRVFVRPCSVNRLQSTSHENSHRGPTRGLIEFKFSNTYSRVNGLCFGYFQMFPERSPFDQKLRCPLLPMYPDFPTIRYMDSRKLVQRTNTWVNRVDFFYTYSRVNRLCFGYFQMFPARSPFDLKITLTPPPYVSRLSDHTVRV